jgi:hypothetical protein
MRLFFSTTGLLCALALGACESGSPNQAAESRSLDVYGGQSRYSVPIDQTTAAAPQNASQNQAPYSLEGTSNRTTPAQTNSYVRFGTNGGF